jgi:hypothetical protein
MTAAFRLNDPGQYVEFVEDAEQQSGGPVRSYPVGENLRAVCLGEFVETVVPIPSVPTLRSFVVLCKSGSPVTVRGHGLKRSNGTSEPHGDFCEVFVTERGREIIVAMFPADSINGIYEGGAPVPRSPEGKA